MKDKGKFLILLFVGSEAFFFIALIIAYIYYRNINQTADLVSQNLDVETTGIFTICLILSSFTMIWAKRSFAKKKLKNYKIALGITIILGIVFLVGQVKEYIGLYDKQLTMSKSIFGSSFFTLTGFHGIHVVLGVITLLILFALSSNKTIKVAAAGMGGIDVYWHFVDIVWIFVFFTVYIIPLL